MTVGQGGIPADWYADPNNPQQLRYWDGTQWTEHVNSDAAPATVASGPVDVTRQYAPAAQKSGGPGVPLVALLVILALGIGFGGGYVVGDSGTEAPAKVNNSTQQRDAELKGTLKDAATAQESYFTDFSTYTSDVGRLASDGGFSPHPGVTLIVLQANVDAYCMRAAKTDQPGDAWFISSANPAPTKTPCR